MKTKFVAQNVEVSTEDQIEVISTPGNGCYGIFMAPAVRGGEVKPEELCLFLETNGDPIMIPMPCDVDYEEMFSAVLNDAEVTEEELTEALSVVGKSINDFWS